MEFLTYLGFGGIVAIITKYFFDDKTKMKDILIKEYISALDNFLISIKDANTTSGNIEAQKRIAIYRIKLSIFGSKKMAESIDNIIENNNEKSYDIFMQAVKDDLNLKMSNKIFTKNNFFTKE